jgi:hypothetical protein
MKLDELISEYVWDKMVNNLKGIKENPNTLVVYNTFFNKNTLNILRPATKDKLYSKLINSYDEPKDKHENMKTLQFSDKYISLHITSKKHNNILIILDLEDNETRVKKLSPSHSEINKIINMNDKVLYSKTYFTEDGNLQSNLVLINPKTLEEEVLTTENNRINSMIYEDNKIIYCGFLKENDKFALKSLDLESKEKKTLALENGPINDVTKIEDKIIYGGDFYRNDEFSSALISFDMKSGKEEIISEENGNIESIVKYNDKIMYGGSFSRTKKKTSDLVLYDPKTKEFEIVYEETEHQSIQNIIPLNIKSAINIYYKL